MLKTFEDAKMKKNLVKIIKQYDKPNKNVNVHNFYP